MKFFLDTADIKVIKELNQLALVDGVTTNPSLIAQEGVDLKERILEICNEIDGPISCEVLATDHQKMVEEGLEYHSWHKNIFVKLPCTDEGLKALKILKSKDVKVNMTLVFSPMQALACAKLGADFVSPFLGRLDDTQCSGLEILEQIIQIYENYGLKTQVLAASIRSVDHVVNSALLGSDIATISPKVFQKMLKHPLTDIGLAKFLEDYKNSQK